MVGLPTVQRFLSPHPSSESGTRTEKHAVSGVAERCKRFFGLALLLPRNSFLHPVREHDVGAPHARAAPHIPSPLETTEFGAQTSPLVGTSFAVRVSVDREAMPLVLALLVLLLGCELGIHRTRHSYVTFLFLRL